MTQENDVQNIEVKESFFPSAILPSCKKINLQGDRNDFLFIRDEFLIAKEVRRLAFDKPNTVLLKGYVGTDGMDKLDQYEKFTLPGGLTKKDFENLEKAYFQIQESKEVNISDWKAKNSEKSNPIGDYISRDARKKEFAEILEKQKIEE